MSKVYLIFTRSNSVVSSCIHLFTGDKFTHVSISFDEHIECMYSFGRRLAHVNWPAGLVEEHLDKGFYAINKNIPCEIYSIECSQQCYEKAKTIVLSMYEEKLKYKFSLVGLFLCKRNIAQKRPNKYFCSQFVSEILSESGICSLDKDPSLIRPMDLYELDKKVYVTEGKVAQVSKELKQNY